MRSEIMKVRLEKIDERSTCSAPELMLSKRRLIRVGLSLCSSSLLDQSLMFRKHMRSKHLESVISNRKLEGHEGKRL